MLSDIFPKLHHRYSALPLFGSMIESFGDWLFDHGYHRGLVRTHIRSTRRLDFLLRNRGCDSVQKINREVLRVCAPRNSQDDIGLASAVRLWERYFDDSGLLPKPVRTPADLLTIQYHIYLEGVRGASHSTLTQHCWTASRFLMHVGYNKNPSCIAAIGREEIERYIRARGQRSTRGSLQHEIAHLRSFLRFLLGRGEVKPGLEDQIDTPRL